MTREDFKTIGDLAAKVTELQDKLPELVEVATELWNLYKRNGGHKREFEFDF